MAKAPEVEPGPQGAAESPAGGVGLSVEWASLLEETKEPASPLGEISAGEAVTAEAASNQADLAASFLEQGMSMKKSTPARPAQPSGELPEFEVPADSPVEEEEATTESKEIPVEMA